MSADPTPHGFGPLTLWIAPPLLVIGFTLPVIGILGHRSVVQVCSNPVSRANRIQTFLGFTVFALSLALYVVTLEPTASLWDCSEFIASAYKLQVPHTPGTPLSLLIGRVFTMLAWNDTTQVAWTLNFMSAFSSALTVLMVFYILCHFATCMTGTGKHPRASMLVAAVCGSLILAVSDSFWFSAVEAETYGLACFFLTLLAWLILTGSRMPEPDRAKRLMLIFYVAGLAYCIHPMCVLALAILPFAWYSRDKNITLRSTTVCAISGLAIVFMLNKFVAIGLFEATFSIDFVFVNTLHLPFYSGAIFLFISLIAVSWWLITKFPKLRTYTWCLILLICGFLPYLVLFVRSNQNPPIDETNPEDLSLIKAYMNRESYPSSPLLFGPYFDARIKSVFVKKEIHFKGDTGYHKAGSLHGYEYEKNRQTILPRIYSNDPDHIKTYRRWTGLKSHEKPTFTDNLEFLFKYQLGHMYLRYMMFNFAGRESDIQNSPWLKPWEPLKGSSQFANRARNQYWMVPLLLGLFGAFKQFARDRKGFAQVTTLFLITGLVLAVYLNSPPNEPRERDYIYVGSYIAFSLWIGLGIMAVYGILARSKSLMAAVGVLALALPGWMAYQNFDDHDRSGRTFQIDNARNTLNSCVPNAIIFTGGDNDTFPFWYLQDVEGVRTDVRVMVLSYMNTDWYINQLRRPYYNSAAFRLFLSEDDYRQHGPNDVLYVDERLKTPVDARQYLEFLNRRHPSLIAHSSTGEPYHILPSKTLLINIDGEKLQNDTFVKTRLPANTPQPIELQLTEPYLQKNALAIIDLILNNNWERPVYFNFTSMNGIGLDLEPYLVQEGPVWRLTPIRNNGKNLQVDTQRAYRNLVENANYENLQRSDVYFTHEDHFLRMIVPLRQSLNTLALAFLMEGEKEKCTYVLKHAARYLYPPHLPPSYTNLQAGELLINIDEDSMAEAMLTPLFEFYHTAVTRDLATGVNPDDLDVFILDKAAELLASLGRNEYRSMIDSMGLAR